MQGSQIDHAVPFNGRDGKNFACVTQQRLISDFGSLISRFQLMAVNPDMVSEG
jgi:hypothetical protein